MNCLGIDFGTKRIGLAVSINGIISPLEVVANNDGFILRLQRLISEYDVSKIYVGVSEGKIAVRTNKFVTQLRSVLQCTVETVEEAVSTIEADQIYRDNQRKKKNYKSDIDSVAAAVILRRVIS